MSPVAAVQPPESLPQNTKCDDVTPEKATYSDSSGAIFSIYITHTQHLDEENVENWKGVADRILIFTGLFSATVAIFIAISYPNLQQDPNIITQSLLSQISQQLSNASSNDASATSNASIQSSFIPPGSVVFINSVWFLSLVLSLMCALLATFLQQWARRYLHAVRQNHPPHVRAHIREYFARGARRFHIFGLVEALPLLLLVSMHLFFAGLVAFAFRANHTVAYFTTAIVGFSSLSYIALTLLPLIFHDCPYYTPLTSVLWFSSQMVPLSFFSILYHGAKQWYGRWGTDGEGIVKLFRDRYKKKANSLSEGLTYILENSAKRTSIDIYKSTLVRTLHRLNEDHDLEEFVDGIPGLCESRALATRGIGDTQHTIRDVLATLPGPTNFHASLPWSIIQLAQRTFTNKLPKSVQNRRTRACLRALYYIPGAIRDVLTPYAAEKRYSSEILPLLNSQESLEIINELQNTLNDDVALPARCVAAVVTSYMVTPSPPSTPNEFFIGDHNSGEQFLDDRLRVDAFADGGANPNYLPRSESARLQNIVRFLIDIKDTLGKLNKQWWSSNNAELIRKESKELFSRRGDLTEGYRTGNGKFDQQSDGDRRASPAFMPAAQLDLITLTLEILARDSVAGAATSQREAFRAAYEEFKQVAFTQAMEQAQDQRLGQPLAQMLVLSASDQEDLAWISTQAWDGTEMVKRALEPVTQSLQLWSMPTPHHDPRIAPATAGPEDGPVSAHAVLAQRSAPQPIEAIPSPQYSMASFSARREADAGEFSRLPV
ncbi:hypothetical protein EDB92DRAFT_1943456 [Lactarius akahatsu]|uniref:DUF6535 domain-containing protein n=1 Tax=Lactarius akahatsu TaxID=416441 RepID=A0AAD4LLT9_9AGAM|nr:hypothetical protein EDB92DRAFT_1943456 [Lactarius akahatsu]